jgi:hypothetical protein
LLAGARTAARGSPFAKLLDFLGIEAHHAVDLRADDVAPLLETAERPVGHA